MVLNYWKLIAEIVETEKNGWRRAWSIISSLISSGTSTLIKKSAIFKQLNLHVNILTQGNPWFNLTATLTARIDLTIDYKTEFRDLTDA